MRYLSSFREKGEKKDKLKSKTISMGRRGGNPVLRLLSSYPTRNKSGMYGWYGMVWYG